MLLVFCVQMQALAIPRCDGVDSGLLASASQRNCSGTLQVMKSSQRERTDGRVMFVGDCHMRWFSSSEAEDLLDGIGQLLFIGDSLIRHFQQGVAISFLNNYNSGALKADIDVDPSDCYCEAQFEEKVCREHVRHQYRTSSGKGVLQLLHWFLVDQIDKQKLQRLVGEKPHTVIVVGGGLHWNLDADTTILSFITPLMWWAEEAALAAGTRVHFLWAPVHAQGINKPEEFRQSQDNVHVQAHNKAVATFCERVSIPVFDTFALTEMASSYDGQHYGMSVNVLKSQLLLNYLSEYQGGRGG